MTYRLFSYRELMKRGGAVVTTTQKKGYSMINEEDWGV